jgi:hypothetical protein
MSVLSKPDYPLKADFEYLVDQELFGSDGVEQGRK